MLVFVEVSDMTGDGQKRVLGADSPHPLHAFLPHLHLLAAFLGLQKLDTES